MCRYDYIDNFVMIGATLCVLIELGRAGVRKLISANRDACSLTDFRHVTVI